MQKLFIFTRNSAEKFSNESDLNPFCLVHFGFVFYYLGALTKDQDTLVLRAVRGVGNKRKQCQDFSSW